MLDHMTRVHPVKLLTYNGGMTLTDRDKPPVLPGQMDVEECIEIAETGKDGVTRHVPKQDDPEPRRPLSAGEVVARKLKGQLPS